VSEKRVKMDRREFIRKAAVGGAAAVAGAAGFPTIVRAAALGRDGAVAPSDRIVMAGIGFGMQGPSNMRTFLGKSEVQWVAVCDLDEAPLKRAQDTVNRHYGNTACATYKDYRELFARGDLDAVSIAVPDHWHAILSIAAVRAGLDVFAQEPAAATGEFTDPIVSAGFVYGTHHIGASTNQAQEAIAAETVRIVSTFMRSGQVPNVVNLAKQSPATHRLIVRHRDRPGVLAHVFEQLRMRSINAQETENVVFAGAEAAVARINLDAAPDAGALAAIREGHPDVLTADVVKL